MLTKKQYETAAHYWANKVAFESKHRATQLTSDLLRSFASISDLEQTGIGDTPANLQCITEIYETHGLSCAIPFNETMIFVDGGVVLFYGTPTHRNYRILQHLQHAPFRQYHVSRTGWKPTSEQLLSYFRDKNIYLGNLDLQIIHAYISRTTLIVLRSYGLSVVKGWHNTLLHLVPTDRRQEINRIGLNGGSLQKARECHQIPMIDIWDNNRMLVARHLEYLASRNKPSHN